MTLTAAVMDAHSSIWSTAGILGSRMKAIASPGTPASTAWPVANDAYAVPFSVAVPVTFVRAFFIAGTTPGTANFDIGIYRDNFTLIRSLGATACVNTTDGVQPVGGGAFSTPVTLTRGRYFLVMSAAATSITCRSQVTLNQLSRSLGWLKMAAAYPLPATFVPASMGASSFNPTLGLLTAAGTIL